MGLEIGIALEIVGQEAQANLEGNELSRHWKQLLLLWNQKARGGFEISVHQRLEIVDVHPDLGSVRLVFDDLGGGGAHHVAKVVEYRAGHHGIEVDHAHARSGGGVDQHIVELGVVMGHALGQLAGDQQVEHGVHQPLAGNGEFDVGLHVRRAVEGVGLDGFHQRVVARARVVKVRDRFVQPSGQVGQLALKLAKGLGCLERLLRVFHHIDPNGPLDEEIGAPKITFRIPEKILAVDGRHQRQRSTVELFRSGGLELDALVADHAANVVHQARYVLEDLVVYPLEDIMRLAAGIVEDRPKGVVDMPRAIRLCIQEFSRALECYCGFIQ